MEIVGVVIGVIVGLAGAYLVRRDWTGNSREATAVVLGVAMMVLGFNFSSWIVIPGL